MPRFILIFLCCLLPAVAWPSASLQQQLRLPAGTAPDAVLQPLYERSVRGAPAAGSAPVIRSVALGMPGSGRLLGRVVFDRPLDLAQSTLQLYLDLDDDPATGRRDDTHGGVEAMLYFADSQMRVVQYGADTPPAPGHGLFAVQGDTLWFTFAVDDELRAGPVRLYGHSRQGGLASSAVPAGTRGVLRSGSLAMAPLDGMQAEDLPPVSLATVPPALAEELALPAAEPAVRTLFAVAPGPLRDNGALGIRRIAVAHLGGDRLFFQIDTDRDIETAADTIILYLDADDDLQTGREDAAHRGIDLMAVAANNGFSINRRKAGMTVENTTGRARVSGSTLYMVLDTPLPQGDLVKLRGYAVTQLGGLGGSNTGPRRVSLPRGHQAVASLPTVSPDMLSRAGYRYVADRVAYESFQNKGLEGSSIRSRGYVPERSAPLPQFASEGRAQPDAAGAAGTAAAVADNAGRAAEVLAVPVSVKEEAGVARADGLIRFSVSVPQGELWRTDAVRLLGADGQPRAAEVQATAFWPDDSIKWLVLTTTDNFSPGQEREYSVVLRGGQERATAEQSSTDSSAAVIRTETAPDGLLVDTGAVRVFVSSQRFEGLSRVQVQKGGVFESLAVATGGGFTVTDQDGVRYSSANVAPDSFTVEEQTRGRLTLRVAGSYASEQGVRYMSYVTRLTFHAGQGRVDVAHTHLNTELAREFTDMGSLTYALAFANGTASPSFGVLQQATERVHGHGTAQLPVTYGTDGMSLLQWTDLQAQLLLDAQTHVLKRTPGAVGVQLGDLSLAVAVTDFWQRWPKGVVVAADELRLELLPVQPSADFGADLPSHLMFPFVQGRYRLKWGMSFTERMVFAFAAEPLGDALVQSLWAESQWPLVAVLPSAWYRSSGAFGSLAEQRADQFALWDDYFADSFADHMARKEAQREYGFLNYGDWFGERGRNWGNNEYDLPHALFSQFVRTGNSDYYRYALRAARHQADVDIVHAYPDPYYIGANHEHSVGHTGQWSQTPTNATWSYAYDSHTAAGNGHTWADGMADAWLLAADPVVMESALKLGDHIAFAFAPSFRHLGDHERTAGWSMRALGALYRASSDPVYLQAAGRIGEVALSEQDPGGDGVWPHKLHPAHARGMLNARGNNVFLIGVLLSGLSSYHEHTGDPRYAEAIRRAGGWINRNWNAGAGGWPYSVIIGDEGMAPAVPALNPLIYDALLYAGLLADDPAMIETAQAAIASTFMRGGRDSFGKDISLKGFFTGESLGRLQTFYERRGQGDKPFLDRSDAFVAELLRSFPLAQGFAVRTPQERVFLVDTAGAAALEASRYAFGSLAGKAPEGELLVTNPAGAVVRREAFATVADSVTTLVLPQAQAGEWRVTAKDGRSVVWSVAAQGGVVRSLVSPGYSIGGIARGRYLIDVPAGTTHFEVEATGIHAGPYGVALLDPQGQLRGYYAGANEGRALLDRKPGQSTAAHGSAVHRLKVEVLPQEPAGQWSLLLWAAGDIGLELFGIPPYLSLQPLPDAGAARLLPSQATVNPQQTVQSPKTISDLEPVLALKSAADPKPVLIGLIGDSTVSDYPASSPLRGWGQMLPELLAPGVSVSNEAISGKSTRTFPRDRWQALLAKKPDFVLIQFGHNDSHARDKPESTDAATEYREHLRTFIRQAREAGSTPVLVTPVRRRLFTEGRVRASNLSPYAEAIHIVGKETGVAVIDLHELSGELFGRLGEAGSEPFTVNRNNDRTHFTAEGARAVAGLVASGLQQVQPQLIDPVRVPVAGSAPEAR